MGATFNADRTSINLSPYTGKRNAVQLVTRYITYFSPSKSQATKSFPEQARQYDWRYVQNKEDLLLHRRNRFIVLFGYSIPGIAFYVPTTFPLKWCWPCLGFCGKRTVRTYQEKKKIAQWYDSLYFKSHTHLILTVDALNSGEFLGFKPSNPCDRIDSPIKTPVLFSDMQISDWVFWSLAKTPAPPPQCLDTWSFLCCTPWGVAY